MRHLDSFHQTLYQKLSNKNRTTSTHRSGSSGFTLVEMLVVMAIIGILAALGLTGFAVSRVRGRDAERKNTLGQVQRALEMYYNDYNRYPPDTEIEWGQPFTDENNVYMSILPQDAHAPAQDYVYQVSDDGQRYKLYARLENDQDAVTDIDDDGTPGDTYDVSCGSAGNCNYGVSSSSTTMEDPL